jgi:hypothetical protein
MLGTRWARPLQMEPWLLCIAGFELNKTMRRVEKRLRLTAAVLKEARIKCMRAKVVGLPPPCSALMSEYNAVPSIIIMFNPYESANQTVLAVVNVSTRHSIY